MSELPKSVWREFLFSPHHAVLAFATLGAGFLSAEPLYLVGGATAYVVGLIFGPDVPLFRRYLERKQEAAKLAAERGELAEFTGRRDALLKKLTAPRRDRYFALAKVCEDVVASASGQDGDDPRLRKIEELMWTFLRLLAMEESLDEFLEIEARDDIAGRLVETREEVERLRSQIESLEPHRASGALEAQERLLTSRLELLETLGKRAERRETAQANLALVRSEEERLDEQIKLIRADSIASRNAAALTARIDATVDHLEHTNQWLAEMDQFRDLLTDLPASGQRAGFGEQLPAPPPLPPPRGKNRA